MEGLSNYITPQPITGAPTNKQHTKLDKGMIVRANSCNPVPMVMQNPVIERERERGNYDASS